VSTVPDTPPPRASRYDPGVVLCILVGVFLLGFALSVDFPRRAFGFQSDGATYYSLAWSLAEDLDFAFERRDLERVWKEFPTGPEGIFLKKGKALSIERAEGFPFVRIVKRPDPRTDRLYYGKAYIYPLFAAPFVRVFGTNGFLVFHALLLTGCVAAAYYFLRARSSPGAATAYALVFFLASAVPVYLVWLTPEIFNLAVVLFGLFAWSYKEVAEPVPGGRAPGAWGRLLRSPRSDLLAAILLGIAAFSKPTNIVAAGPMLLMLLARRQWRRVLVTGGTFVLVVVGLFGINAAITGEINYQGGDRNTFYGATRFPFQEPGATFDNTGMPRATDRVPVDVLFTRDALLEVFPRNLIYFTTGRHTGLVPYFFPGVLSLMLFLAWYRRQRPFQWALVAGVVAGSLALMLYMPFTYSGGGGPVGNRYFMGFYALFLFVTPPLASAWAAVVAAAIGGLFTAQLALNPFYTSFHPAEHMKTGPYRLLPVELSLVNDLPVNVTPSRARQPLAGDPPLVAYFLDNNAYDREGEWFWVRGEARAEMILRAPARLRPDGGRDSLRVRRLLVEVRAGDVPNEVVIRTGAQTTTVRLEAGETRTVPVAMPGGLPYRPTPGHPTNYTYTLAIATERGFVPMFASGARDNRYLGAMVRVVPVYEPE
jgi:hypothetical protein